jgi:hypothetical protein
MAHPSSCVPDAAAGAAGAAEATGSAATDGNGGTPAVLGEVVGRRTGGHGEAAVVGGRVPRTPLVTLAAGNGVWGSWAIPMLRELSLAPAAGTCPPKGSLKITPLRERCSADASTTATGPGALQRGGYFISGPFAGPLSVASFNSLRMCMRENWPRMPSTTSPFPWSRPVWEGRK